MYFPHFRGRFSVRVRLAACGLLLAAPIAAEDRVGTPRLDPPATPSLNTYGLPGLVDMPTAEAMPNGQIATSVSYFGGISRYTLSFQAAPWLSASFRYSGLKTQGDELYGFETYWDRNFDVRFRLMQETRNRPALTLGLQDFAGTGVNAAEYIVATKGFDTPPLSPGKLPGRLKLTAGLGWGRLGSYGSMSGAGTRPGYGNSNGGELSYDQWFRGDFAPFAGVEWQLDDRWSVKAEYSSDAYDLETGPSDVLEHKSPVNIGTEYQWTPRTRLGAYYLYGSEIGVSAQIQLNPSYPAVPLQVPAPHPVPPRSAWATEESQWGQAWAQSEETKITLADLLGKELRKDGLTLESLDLNGTRAELRYRNARYHSYAQANGRAARAMSRALPASVETFRIIPVRNGLGLSALELRRSDLEAMEFDPEAAATLTSVVGVTTVGPQAAGAIPGAGLYPAFSTSINPYTSPSYFDPDKPFRIDAGLDFGAVYDPAPGWRVAGTIRQRIAGNVAGGRKSESQLPHVRTDQSLYAEYGTTLENLYAARYWQPKPAVFARSTAGLFESMYGGISGEVLWQRPDSPLGLGFEGNYVVQRDFDQRLSFRDYKTFTGHASAYLNLDKGYQAQVDAGRYLAGDYGATFSVGRVFENGWEVSGFVTKTNVSAEEFGEGSFDKGFRVRIPVSWMLGKPTRSAFGTTIRPVQRDGGQRVHMPDRLYNSVRAAQRQRLREQQARFWE